MGNYQYKAKNEDLTWYIPKDEMHKLIKEFSINDKIENDESFIVLPSRETNISLKGGHTIIIKKKKNDKAEIVVKK